MSCIPPCSHDAKCQSDYSRWPFDVQNCSLHIGTWVNSGEEIDFKLLKTVISESERDSQSRSWRLIQATYRRNPGNFSEAKSTYPSLTFTFTIQRHSATYAAMILGPALGKWDYSPSHVTTIWIWKLNRLFCVTVFIVFVAFNLIALWIDPENIQRIIILAISMFAHLYYLQWQSWLVPNNGDDCPDIGELNTNLQF